MTFNSSETDRNMYIYSNQVDLKIPFNPHLELKELRDFFKGRHGQKHTVNLISKITTLQVHSPEIHQESTSWLEEYYIDVLVNEDYGNPSTDFWIIEIFHQTFVNYLGGKLTNALNEDSSLLIDMENRLSKTDLEFAIKKFKEKKKDDRIAYVANFAILKFFISPAEYFYPKNFTRTNSFADCLGFPTPIKFRIILPNPSIISYQVIEKKAESLSSKNLQKDLTEFTEDKISGLQCDSTSSKIDSHFKEKIEGATEITKNKTTKRKTSNNLQNVEREKSKNEKAVKELKPLFEHEVRFEPCPINTVIPTEMIESTKIPEDFDIISESSKTGKNKKKVSIINPNDTKIDSKNNNKFLSIENSIMILSTHKNISGAYKDHFTNILNEYILKTNSIANIKKLFDLIHKYKIEDVASTFFYSYLNTLFSNKSWISAVKERISVCTHLFDRFNGLYPLNITNDAIHYKKGKELYLKLISTKLLSIETEYVYSSIFYLNTSNRKSIKELKISLDEKKKIKQQSDTHFDQLINSINSINSKSNLMLAMNILLNLLENNLFAKTEGHSPDEMVTQVLNKSKLFKDSSSLVEVAKTWLIFYAQFKKPSTNKKLNLLYKECIDKTKSIPDPVYLETLVNILMAFGKEFKEEGCLQKFFQDPLPPLELMEILQNVFMYYVLDMYKNEKESNEKILNYFHELVNFSKKCKVFSSKQTRLTALLDFYNQIIRQQSLNFSGFSKLINTQILEMLTKAFKDIMGDEVIPPQYDSVLFSAHCRYIIIKNCIDDFNPNINKEIFLEEHKNQKEYLSAWEREMSDYLDNLYDGSFPDKLKANNQSIYLTNVFANIIQTQIEVNIK